MTNLEKTRSDLLDLSQKLPSLAELARDAAKLPLFVAEYQRWLSRSLRLVGILGPDRLVEFQGYYLPDPRRRSVDDSTYCIQDYILAVRPSQDSKFDIHRAVVLRLTAQVTILQSLESRLEGVFAEIGGELLATLEESELATARRLVKVSPRAASALTAAILETHLLRVARCHDLKLSPGKPTIEKLNNLLKEAGVCDDTSWRSTSLVHDKQLEVLTNKKVEPNAATVEGLIAQVESILKRVV